MKKPLLMAWIFSLPVMAMAVNHNHYSCEVTGTGSDQVIIIELNTDGSIKNFQIGNDDIAPSKITVEKTSLGVLYSTIRQAPIDSASVQKGIFISDMPFKPSCCTSSWIDAVYIRRQASRMSGVSQNVHPIRCWASIWK